MSFHKDLKRVEIPILLYYCFYWYPSPIVDNNDNFKAPFNLFIDDSYCWRFGRKFTRRVIHFRLRTKVLHFRQSPKNIQLT